MTTEPTKAMVEAATQAVLRWLRTHLRGPHGEFGIFENESGDLAEAALTAAMAASGLKGWRPIETAPKDGTKILSWWNDQIIITYWAKRPGFENWQAPSMMSVPAHDKSKWWPTHWMPLPLPPKESEVMPTENAPGTDIGQSIPRSDTPPPSSTTSTAGAINVQDPLLLLASLLRFGPSSDGSVERDLEYAIRNQSARIAALEAKRSTKRHDLSLCAPGYCDAANLLAMIDELNTRAERAEAELAKWDELRRTIAEIEGYDKSWPSHGNAPLAIAASYKLLHQWNHAP